MWDYNTTTANNNNSRDSGGIFTTDISYSSTPSTLSSNVNSPQTDQSSLNDNSYNRSGHQFPGPDYDNINNNNNTRGTYTGAAQYFDDSTARNGRQQSSLFDRLTNYTQRYSTSTVSSQMHNNTMFDSSKNNISGSRPTTTGLGHQNSRIMPTTGSVSNQQAPKIGVGGGSTLPLNELLNGISEASVAFRSSFFGPKVREIHLKDVNCHGFADIYRARTWLGKLFWIAVVITCISGLAWGIFQEAVMFTKGSTASRVTMHHVETLELPDIAVCIPTPLNVTRLLGDGYNISQISAWHYHFQENPYRQIVGDNVYDLPPTVAADDSNMDWGSFVDKYSADCSAVFAQCSKDRKPFDCCERAVQVFHEKLGKCFVFKDLVQDEESVHTGLVALVRSDKSMMIPREYQDATLMPMEHGVILEMTDDYLRPYAYGAHTQLLVPSDSLAYITLEKTEYIKENDCVGGDQHIGFSKGRCKKACVGHVIALYCNCTLLGFDPGPNPEICHPSWIGVCWNMFAKDGFSLANTPENLACIADRCGIPCQQVVVAFERLFIPLRVKTNISNPDSVKETNRVKVNSGAVQSARRRFRMESRGPPLTTDSTETTAKHTEAEVDEYEFTKFHIYYQELIYTKIVEFEILTIHNVLSSLGGQLGLYMGASLITVPQLVLVAWNRCRRQVVTGNQEK